MKINQNNNYQQNPSFEMIRLPIEKDGVAIQYARSSKLSKKIGALRDQGLLKVGRDKDFNLVEYVTTRFNSAEEKKILKSLQSNSIIKLETVEGKIGNSDIVRQDAYWGLLSKKMFDDRDGFKKQFEKLFPGLKTK